MCRRLSIRSQLRPSRFALMLVACCACAGPQPAFTRELEARRLAHELLVQFTHASDASNRAVMADTDESSRAFAREAETQTQRIDADLGALETQLRALDYSEELTSLAAFRRAYAPYQELDRQILVLAVENTNLKAQRLSFGPARAAVARFRSALEPTSKASCPARSLALSAMLAASELEALQAQHIAEADDAQMTQFEAQMTRLEADAHQSLSDLIGLHSAELQPSIGAADAALREFIDIQRQIVALSRRNSNVRSLALALGPKPALSSSCEQALRGLTTHLEQRKLLVATR